ncbi:valine--tRNA ligase [Buchnera aphidicola]|uniref:valine--tRNA ligase n=1 Tax=Buchnera aphidicola TaxID=9 RepID=UPI0031B6C049
MEKNYNTILIEEFVFKKLHQKNSEKYSKINNNYCIMMPPPNITGKLHMGHAFQQIIMDTLIRYHKLLKYNTLLQMGTDHAGIATQLIIEKEIFRKEGKERFNYTRQDFIKKIWKWKKNTEFFIFEQIRKLGISVDWSDIRFTLDKKFSRAVNRVFLKLFKKKLIYQKKKIVYWDPKLRTVLSDLEVKHLESKSLIWYIKYLIFEKKNIKEKKKYIVVSTTRPETLLGDTAIAVNPQNIKYSQYIGKFAIVPIVNRKISIIGDSTVDLNIGTGCLKITPAHDFFDYQIALKHQLYMINIFSDSGKILKKLEVLDYEGNPSCFFDSKIPVILQNEDRFSARKIIIKILKKKNLLHSSILKKNFIPYGERSQVILEPKLTNQWFLCTKKLSKIAIDLIVEKKIIFFPKQYKNMFLSWMLKIEDWCISRQLWWGHRFPIWYDEHNNIYIAENEKEVRKKYFLKKHVILLQDTNVLDTWFSSSLWTFVGLGWPKCTKKFKMFHPTEVLVSGFDIIFFWIARMIMMTAYILKDNKNNNFCIPFKKVYITGLICDDNGKKMSKSQGNILDPLDIVYGIKLKKLIIKRTKNLTDEKMLNNIKKNIIQKFPHGIKAYGIDALRLTFLSLSSTSRYISWDMNRVKGYKHFCNKLWNVSRFICLKIEKKFSKNFQKIFYISILDKWIFFKLQVVIKNYHNYFKNFRFDLLVALLYDFVWYQFCDKYIENIKCIFLEEFSWKKFHVLTICIQVLKKILKLLYPIIPFITQYIWMNMVKILKNFSKKKYIMNLPKIINVDSYKSSFDFIEWFYKIIFKLRKIRSDLKFKYNYSFEICIKNLSYNKKIFLNENYNLLKKIAFLTKITFFPFLEIKKFFISYIIDEIEIFIFLPKSTYLEYLKKKNIQKNIKIELIIKKLKLQLSNHNFLFNAPQSLILKKKKLLKKYKKIKKIYT